MTTAQTTTQDAAQWSPDKEADWGKAWSANEMVDWWTNGGRLCLWWHSRDCVIRLWVIHAFWAGHHFVKAGHHSLKLHFHRIWTWRTCAALSCAHYFTRVTFQLRFSPFPNPPFLTIHHWPKWAFQQTLIWKADKHREMTFHSWLNCQERSSLSRWHIMSDAHGPVRFELRRAVVSKDFTAFTIQITWLDWDADIDWHHDWITLGKLLITYWPSICMGETNAEHLRLSLLLVIFSDSHSSMRWEQ
jgi:hypothetical protein